MAGRQKASGVGKFPWPDQKAMTSGFAMPYMAAVTMPLSGSFCAGRVMLLIRSVISMASLKAKENPQGNACGLPVRYACKAYFLRSESRISASNTSVVDAAGGGAGGSARFILLEILTSCIRMKARIRKPMTMVMKLP